MRYYKSPLFQHRHYAEIAALLSQIEAGDTPDEIVSAFAAMFKRDNDRFDWDRFMAATRDKPSNSKDARTSLTRALAGLKANIAAA